MTTGYSSQAWPFLIGRSAQLDQQVIVAPRFLIDANLTHLLVSLLQTESLPDPPGHATLRKSMAAGRGIDEIAAIYRTSYARGEMIGRAREHMLDHHGREILLVEGVIFRGKEDPSSLDLDTLDRLHEYLTPLYQIFWESSSQFTPIPSDPIAISLATSATDAVQVHIRDARHVIALGADSAAYPSDGVPPGIPEHEISSENSINPGLLLQLVTLSSPPQQFLPPTMMRSYTRSGWIRFSLVAVCCLTLLSLWYVVIIRQVRQGNSMAQSLRTPCTYFCGTSTVTDPLIGVSVMKWEQYDDGNITCTFGSDGYHLRVHMSPAGVSCPESNRSFSDFATQFDMQFLQGVAQGASSSRASFVFRTASATSFSDSYVVSLSMSGHYEIAVKQGCCNTTIGSGEAAPIFRTGLHQTNLIGVVAKGTTLMLFVNGQHIWSGHDITYSNGDLAFEATDVFGSPSGTVVEVVFSHLRIWQK